MKNEAALHRHNKEINTSYIKFPSQIRELVVLPALPCTGMAVPAPRVPEGAEPGAPVLRDLRELPCAVLSPCQRWETGEKIVDIISNASLI